MRDINLLSLDLEMNQPSGTIIQVGAVVGNLASGEILEEVSCFINPHETLSEYIIKLTNIKQHQVDCGVSLQEGYKVLQQLHTKYKCFRNSLCWGGGDSQELKQQLNYPDDEMFLFGRRWIDAKTLYVSLRFASNQKHQAGLSKAMARLGLQFQGKKHNATVDAKNTFLIYKELLRRFKCSKQ